MNICDNNTIVLQTALALTLTAITIGLAYPLEMVRRTMERCDACCGDVSYWSIPIFEELVQCNGEKCVICGDVMDVGYSRNVSFGYADYPRLCVYPPKTTTKCAG